jgi:PERQ amino acid-rich with GYF domain-containing protein
MERGSHSKQYFSNRAARPRRANGATQTFRRPSHAPTLSGSTSQSTSREASGPMTSSSANPGVYVPPHAQFGRNGSSAEGRYSRDQLLQLFHAQRETEDIRDGMSGLYVGGWEPNISNGTSNATWGRRDDPSRETQSGVDLCWDRDGSTLPLSLSDMTEEEKEVCQFPDSKFLPRLIFSSLRPSPRQSIRL